jgi:hypothetical protein
MKVWIGYKCYDDYCTIDRVVGKLFDDEAKAVLWVEDTDFIAYAKRIKDEDAVVWREYKAMDVE